MYSYMYGYCLEALTPIIWVVFWLIVSEKTKCYLQILLVDAINILLFKKIKLQFQDYWWKKTVNSNEVQKISMNFFNHTTDDFNVN